MKKLGSKYRRDLRPDAQSFDEIRLVTVPRYKQSGLSGDEWRISIIAKFFRKGVLKNEKLVSGNMEQACALLSSHYLDNTEQYYGGEDDFCDQEGCSNKATVTYKKKFSYCSQGHKTENEFSTPVRMFCDVHKVRGDCGLDDADANYEIKNEKD